MTDKKVVEAEKRVSPESVPGVQVPKQPDPLEDLAVTHNAIQAMAAAVNLLPNLYSVHIRTLAIRYNALLGQIEALKALGKALHESHAKEQEDLTKEVNKNLELTTALETMTAHARKLEERVVEQGRTIEMLTLGKNAVQLAEVTKAYAAATESRKAHEDDADDGEALLPRKS